MDNYSVLDYVPVIGDVYRYGKIGWKIGSWLANEDDSYNNRIQSNMIDCINRAANSDSVLEALNSVVEALRLVEEMDISNAKKYQLALTFYLAARACHVYALCLCIIDSDNLKVLKKAGKAFSDAKGFCNKVWEVDKTLLTSKRELIDQVREAANSKKTEISESRSNWRKQYRALYKKENPWKWYLGMWIFA